MEYMLDYKECRRRIEILSIGQGVWDRTVGFIQLAILVWRSLGLCIPCEVWMDWSTNAKIIKRGQILHIINNPHWPYNRDTLCHTKARILKSNSLQLVLKKRNVIFPIWTCWNRKLQTVCLFLIAKNVFLFVFDQGLVENENLQNKHLPSALLL